MTMGILYRITFENGKAYVGITTETLQRRVQRHIHYARSNKPYALSRAIRKYGEKSFLYEVIDACDDWAGLLKLEIEAIKKYDCMAPSGYNMTAGGEGSKGVVVTVEKREKISKSLSGRRLTEAHRKAIGDAQKGKTIPLETRKKMSEAHKKRPPMSEEQRRLRSELAKLQHAASYEIKAGAVPATTTAKADDLQSGPLNWANARD